MQLVFVGGVKIAFISCMGGGFANGEVHCSLSNSLLRLWLTSRCVWPCVRRAESQRGVGVVVCGSLQACVEPLCS